MDGFVSKKVSVKGSNEEKNNIQISLDPIEVLITAAEVELAPIFFEFDQSNVTAQAAFELDKLVQIMKKYPELVISATSHTDDRGPESYNAILSDRRAKTTVQYVISQGIADTRISGIGKGESEPKIDCSAGCTRDQHAENRRSEFLIVNGSPISE
jgi:outer membrane protein OmpA-like peptidoglycan-associated protein